MRFYKVTVSGSFLPDVTNTRKLGESGNVFLQIHSAEFVGALTGNMTGDVYNNGAEQILENGADRSTLDGWFMGKIRSTNGSPCLNPSGTPSASTFEGTSTKAKYA